MSDSPKQKTASKQNIQRHFTEIEDFLLSVVRNSPVGILALNTDKIVNVSNASLIEIIGSAITPDQAINMPVSEFLDDLSVVVDAVDDAFNESRDQFTLPSVRHKDKYIKVIGRKIAGGMLLFFTDITYNVLSLREVGSALAQQKAIDEMKTEFVSVASHQLRTPLTSLKWNIEMLMDENFGPLNKDQKEVAQDIHESSERMVELINALLNVARLESGKLIIEPLLVDVGAFLENIIQQIDSYAQSNNCHIRFENEMPKGTEVPLDAGLISQVMNNLLSNAIRYSARGKTDILVKLEASGNVFRITVRDSGPGIKQEDQPRVFEKFFRSSDAHRKVARGTGLGLYISKMIVEASGGKIWFDSTVGEGTAFYVELPLIPPTEKI